MQNFSFNSLNSSSASDQNSFLHDSNNRRKSLGNFGSPHFLTEDINIFLADTKIGLLNIFPCARRFFFYF